MINELETIAFARALPDVSLEAGDLGTVVHVYQDGRGYELDFVTWHVGGRDGFGRRGPPNPATRDRLCARGGVT
ncbi:MAG TPA: DUF4926 domain-containing protein [Hyphomicrobiaceae bacterium]|jgi:hypothetical protein|nr:DUF4926 domain-containing protein [Hyphomicrobiaceae bacterium]